MRYGVVSRAAPVRGGGVSKGGGGTPAAGVPLYLNAPEPEISSAKSSATSSSTAVQSRDDAASFSYNKSQVAVPGAAPAEVLDAVPPHGPSDINLGFNALDASHRLIESIDQSQVKMEDDPYDDARLFKRKRLVRHVDFPAVVAVLSHLTADQVKEVEAEYLAYEKRPLQRDLFGWGESGVETDLTVDEHYRLKALLEGTRASSEDDAEAAAKHQREGDVAELHALLYGKLGSAEIERVMTLLRRSAEDVTALMNEYDLNHDLRADLFKLGTVNAIRAMMLMSGSSIAADGYAIGIARQRIIAIDAALTELQPKELTVTTAILALGSVATPGASMVRRQQIDALNKERKEQVQFIEDRVQIAAGEARKEAEEQGSDIYETDTAIRTRASWVLGADGETEAVVGGTSAKLIHAVATNNPPEIAEAQLRKLDEAGHLTPEIMADTFRSLRVQATQYVQQSFPEATAEELKEEERKLSDQWFIHLRSTWDANVVNDGATFDEVLDRGNQTEVDLKRGLYMASGRLSDADELVYALAGDRKDMDTAKRVLRDKNATEIAEIKRQYQLKTKSLPMWPLGRSLDYDLFGYAPTKVGEQNPVDLNGNKFLPQGKADGTDRLLLEDYAQRPAQEGGVDEVNYVRARAEREYEYTIDNRGATGWWRDHWGNEARSLLDATIKEVRQLWTMYMTGTHYGSDIVAVKSAAAHELIHKMHLARATIRGDRAGYEKATAALRATFQAIASFVLQAVLTAVLMPFATALFAARLAQAGATVVRFAVWTKNAAVGIAATIAANKAVYGNDYTTDMLLHDLKGGLGNVIGAAGVGKLLGPVATGITNRLGTTMGNEVIAGVKTLGGMEATAIIEGEDANVFENFLEQHFLGKVGEFITHGTTKALGLGPANGAHGRMPERAGETETRRPPPSENGVVDAEIVDSPEVVHTSMALDPEIAKSTAARKTMRMASGGGGGGGGGSGGKGGGHGGGNGGAGGGGSRPVAGAGPISNGIPEPIGPGTESTLPAGGVSDGVPEHIGPGSEPTVPVGGVSDGVPEHIGPGAEPALPAGGVSDGVPEHIGPGGEPTLPAGGVSDGVPEPIGPGTESTLPAGGVSNGVPEPIGPGTEPTGRAEEPPAPAKEEPAHAGPAALAPVQEWKPMAKGVSQIITDPIQAARIFIQQLRAGNRNCRAIGGGPAMLRASWRYEYGQYSEHPPAGWLDANGNIVIDKSRVDPRLGMPENEGGGGSTGGGPEPSGPTEQGPVEAAPPEPGPTEPDPDSGPHAGPGQGVNPALRTMNGEVPPRKPGEEQQRPARVPSAPVGGGGGGGGGGAAPPGAVPPLAALDAAHYEWVDQMRAATRGEGPEPLPWQGPVPQLDNQGAWRGNNPAEAYAAYRIALQQGGGQYEAIIARDRRSGEYIVMLGEKGGVRRPADTPGRNWETVMHYHPNLENAPMYTLPAPHDLSTSMMDAGANTDRPGNRPHLEFVESTINGTPTRVTIVMGGDTPMQIEVSAGVPGANGPAQAGETMGIGFLDQYAQWWRAQGAGTRQEIHDRWSMNRDPETNDYVFDPGGTQWVPSDSQQARRMQIEAAERLGHQGVADNIRNNAPEGP